MEQNKDEVKVVVFDLNGTFYNESSKDEFYKYICKKRPKQIKYIAEMYYYKLLRKINKIRETEFKENFFNYLDEFAPEQVESYARDFWKHEYPANFNKELKKKFDKFKESGVLLFCATGGLELYVKPLFDLYKIDAFAGTRVKYTGKTYKVQGLACKEEEKISRLEEYLEGKPYRIIEAYSDSKEEILDKAEKAYLIEDGKLTTYKQE